MRLYRPVGPSELLLVYRSRMRRWPPRLPEQPIFYPVLNVEYATQIARDWNATGGEGAGYVTEFEVDDAYAAQFETKTVGGTEHVELWVPAGELETFNDHIVGQIRLVGAYVGAALDRAIALVDALSRSDAAELARLVEANHETIFACYPAWDSTVPAPALQRVRDAWTLAVPAIPLGVQPHEPRA